MGRTSAFFHTSGRVMKTFADKYPLAAYFLLASAVFWPLSLGIYALQYDAVDVYLPWRFYGSESLRQGMVPLWNPYQDGGYPFYADHQYSIWNPELFLVSLLTRYNATVIQWLFLIYISLGALGFRFLLKQLKLDRSVWFIGGVMFMLSGIIIGHAQSVISILGAVWLPWAIGAYIRALDNDFRPKDVLLLTITMFLMLAGGYQAVSIMLFYLVLAMGIVHFAGLVRKKEFRRLRAFLLGHLSFGVLLVVLLAGIALSIMEVFPYLSRLSGITLEESQLVHFHPKALWSFLYPLASVQEEYRGTSVTAQNMFSGVFVFLLLGYGIWKLRPHLSAHLLVILAFGVIYGLAAFGPHTPVQPLLYRYLPGCNQFFYSAFYRYFAWMALLIVISVGIRYFLAEGKYKILIGFTVLACILYVVSAGTAWSHWDAMDQAVSHTWAHTIRKMGWMPAQLFESIVHAVLLLCFVLILVWRRSVSLLPWMIAIELAVVAQLNMPVTVYGEIRTATLDGYLETRKPGFAVPSNSRTMAENDGAGLYVSIWRNQGNFTNLPCLNGWTSFHLVGREKVRMQGDTLQAWLAAKPFAWVEGSAEVPHIQKFKPGLVRLKLPEQSGGKLIVQQASYPGWIALVDGERRSLETVNEFEQGLTLPDGAKVVELRFENPDMERLFYLTHFGFIILLLVYGVVAIPLGKGLQRGMAATLLLGVIIMRYASFEQVHPTMKLQSGDRTISMGHQLTERDYGRILDFAATSGKSLRLTTGMDDDPRLLGMLHHFYASHSGDRDELIFSERILPDTTTKVIPAKGYYDLTVPGTEGLLVYGMDLGETPASDSVFVVIETKEDDRILYFSAIPVNKVNASGSGRVYSNGYIIPDLSGGRSLKMYLWNNSSQSFTFSNFSLGIIP